MNRREFLSHSIYTIVVFLLVITITYIVKHYLFPTEAEGITRIWDGGGANNSWSTPENWSDNSLPGNGDSVLFDSTNSNDSVIDSGFTSNLASITLASDFGGTITQQRDLNLSENIDLLGGVWNLGVYSLKSVKDLNVANIFNIGVSAGDGVSVNTITITSTGKVNCAGVSKLILTGDFINNGEFNNGDGTVYFQGVSKTQTITTTGVMEDDKFYNVNISGSSNIIQLSNSNNWPLIVDGTLQIGSNSTFDLNGYTFYGNVIANSGVIKVIGTEAVTFNSLNKDSGTVYYYGTDNIEGLNFGYQYYNLTYHSVGYLTLNNMLDIYGDLKIEAGTFDADQATISFHKNGTPFIISTGVFIANESIINYFGLGEVNIASATYYNLVVDNQSSNFNLSGDITVLNQLIITAGNLKGSSRTITFTGGGTPFFVNDRFTPESSTVKYTVGGYVTITATNYYNLTLSPSSLITGGYTVYGAGDDSYNWTFIPAGTHNGKTYYQFGSGSSALYLFYCLNPIGGEAWLLNDQLLPNESPPVLAKYYHLAMYAPTPVCLASDSCRYMAGNEGISPGPYVSGDPGIPVYTMAEGNLSISNNFINGDGVVALKTNANVSNFNANMHNFILNETSEYIANSVGNFFVSGNWDNNGSFTHSNGSVNFNGADEAVQIISGANNFYDFVSKTSENSSHRTIKFETGVTQNVLNNWEIVGENGKIISLTSEGSGNWIIDPKNPTVTYSAISNSSNLGSEFCATFSNDEGGNQNWDISTLSYCSTAPQISSLSFTNPFLGTSNLAIADNYSEWNFQAIAGDQDGASEINYFELQFANKLDDILPYDSLKYRWTEATDQFSEIADSGEYASISSVDTDSNYSQDLWNVNFKIKISENFQNLLSEYSITLLVYDDSGKYDLLTVNNIYQVDVLSINVGVDSGEVNFGTLVPESIITKGNALTITTNYPNGYSLSVGDNVDNGGSSLLHQADQITRVADYESLISSPSLWSSYGFGLCLYQAPNKDNQKWGIGDSEDHQQNKYAGIPQTSTQIYQSDGFVLEEIVKIGYKLGVANSQKTGLYQGDIIYTVVGKID